LVASTALKMILLTGQRPGEAAPLATASVEETFFSFRVSSALPIEDDPMPATTKPKPSKFIDKHAVLDLELKKALASAKPRSVRRRFLNWLHARTVKAGAASALDDALAALGRLPPP
jgi:hypothetical protein